MSLKAKTLAVALGTLIAGTAAADVVSISNDRPQITAGGETWSAERMKNAKPMPMGKVNRPVAESYGNSFLDFTRSRITPQSANTAAPYKAVGKLFFTIPGQGDFVCSASVIRTRLIVTAAHCLYGDGSFFTNWTFVPAFDGSKTGSAQHPLGTWNWNYGIIHRNWIDTNGVVPNNTDFGILEMKDQGSTKISSKTGKLATATAHLFDTHVTMLGYPCNLDSCKIMQRVDSSDHRPGTTDPDNNAFEYGSDMTGGSSGGPWVENFGTGPNPTGGFATRNAVVAVTSYGFTDPEVRIQGASQFNDDFTAILSDACGHKSGNC